MRILVKMAFAVLLAAHFAACSPNNVSVDDSLKKYFDSSHVTGTFGLLDNGQNSFTVCNPSRFKDSVYLPASTFKIITSLVGIETGRISNENMIIKWDGTSREFTGGDTAKTGNKDLTMQEAFRLSAEPYHQEVARRIGKDTLQRWLDSLGYGARYGRAVIKTKVDTFWLDNSVKVTADEQLGLVKKLYFGQLPFQRRTQDIVRKVMLQQQTGKYSLSYQTGGGFAENGNAIGWVTGWVEENKHIYFFALNVEGPHDTDITAAGLGILKDILKQMGFFDGRM